MSNPYFIQNGAGTPGSAGASGFVGGFLDAYKTMAGVGQGTEQNAIAQRKLEEEIRQANMNQALQQAQVQNFNAQTAAKNFETQNFQGYQNAVLEAERQNQQNMNSPGIETPYQPPTEMSPQQRASIVARYFPQQALQAAALPSEVKATEAKINYQAGPQTAQTLQQIEESKATEKEKIAQADTLIPAQAEYYRKHALALMGKEPNPDKMTSEMKNFFAARIPEVFTDRDALPVAMAYLRSPQGQADWNLFYPWVKTNITTVATNEGPMSAPTKPGMPGMPGIPGAAHYTASNGQSLAPAPWVPSSPGNPQQPQVPGSGPAPSNPGNVQAKPIIGPDGKPLKNRLDQSAHDNLNAMVNIADSLNEAVTTLARAPNETGPEKAAYSATIGKLPGTSVNLPFEENKAALAKLYDIVYVKSGKQINETELRVIEKYKPDANDKPAIVALKMRGLQLHLYSMLYNRGMNYQTNGYGIPEYYQPYMKAATDYFQASGKSPIGWGAMGVKNGYQPVGASTETGTTSGKGNPNTQPIIPTYNPKTKRWE